MRVFLTGGTGFIGRALISALEARGDTAVVLTRDVARARSSGLSERTELVAGDSPYAGQWQSHIAGVDAVVNLAGERMDARRWNAQVRQNIHDSRIDTTRLVVAAIEAAPAAQRPSTLVSASGIDFYPADVDLEAFTQIGEDDDVDESAPSGDSFLGRVCRDWEAEASAARAHGVRVVLLRTGLVLGRSGALAKMVLPFRFFVGGRLGSGRQWTSWIHIEDVVGAILFALQTDALSGPINVVAPEPVRNRELACAIGSALRRPSWLPVPRFALQWSVGELSEYLLSGRRAVPKKLVEAGYPFRFPALAAALADLI